MAKAVSSGKKQKAEERKAAKAKLETDKRKAQFEGLDTSNPFLNMENTMEDLTINKKQAEFEAQENQKNQANILGGLKGAAGGSGIASLAQTMANAGQLSSQKAAASIGRQEVTNQKLERGEASRLQDKERQGEVMSRDMERNKVSTLLGMAQGEQQGFNERAADYEAAKWDGITQAGNAGMTAAGSDRNIKKNINKIGKSDSGLNIYSFEYKDAIHGEGLYQGVMSDEVPSEAVIRMDGYDAVNYAMLDVEFKRI